MAPQRHERPKLGNFHRPQKSPQDAHNWFLKCLNTFLDYPRFTFAIESFKIAISDHILKVQFWAKISYFGSLRALWDFPSGIAREMEKCKKNALKVLELHFWHRKSIHRTKVDLGTSWYALKRLISASTKKLPTQFFSLTWLLSQTVVHVTNSRRFAPKT